MQPALVRIHQGGLLLSIILLIFYIFSNVRNEFGIGRFAFGVSNGRTKEFLQSIQISSVASNFDGVSNLPIYARRFRLKDFGNLGIEHFVNGIHNTRVIYCNANGFSKVRPARDVDWYTNFIENVLNTTFDVGHNLFFLSTV